MSCCCSPLGPSDGGGGVPLPDALYVAQLSPAGGDGSIAKPFNTLADGLLALANLGVNFGALLISPGDYSAEGVLHWVGAGALMLKGYSAGVPFPDPFAGPNPQVQLPSITADVGFPDLYLDNVTSAIPQQFNNFTNIFGVGCELQSVITGGDLSLRDSRMLGSMSVGGNVRLWNCEAQTDTNWTVAGTSVELVGTKLTTFSAPIVFGGGAGVVTVDDYSNYYFVGLAVAISNGTKLVAAADEPFKATYYVNPAFVGTSTGSASNPFKTIAAGWAYGLAQGLTAILLLIPLGTTITENVVFPTGGGTYEIAAVGNGVGSTTVGARITGSITLDTVGVLFARLSNLSVTGNTTGNAPTGGAILLTETSVRQNGTITLTQTGTGTATGIFRGFGPAFASKPGGSNTGLVSVAGQITAENWVFEGGCTEAVPTTLTPYPASTWRSCQLGSTNGAAVTMNLNGASNAWFYDCISSGPVTLASTTANYTVYMDGATLAALGNPISGLILTGTGMVLKTINANLSAAQTAANNIGSTAYGARNPAGLYSVDFSQTLTAAGTAGVGQGNVIYTDVTGTLVTAPVGATLNIAGAVGSKVSGSLVFEHNGAAAPIAFSYTGIVTPGAMAVRLSSAIKRLN